jgi:RHS repeat-associated protein
MTSRNPTTVTFSQVWGQEYDLPSGHWKQVVSTGNAREVNYLDSFWRPVYIERWDEADRTNTTKIVKYAYDFAGRTTFESYPRGSYAAIREGVNQAFDALGRPTVTAADSELGMLYSAFGYNSGFEKVHTDARGNSSWYHFQAFDEPSEDAISSISSPEGVYVDIRRDVFGKPSSITRSGGGKTATRTYVYDGNERLCKTIEPETGATVQAYDAANNVLWRATGLTLTSAVCDPASVPAARKVTYHYDARNRLDSTTFADGSPGITRTYTSDGQPDTITSNGVVWSNAYNKRRLNKGETMSYGGVAYNIVRSFDANGSLTQLTYPDNTAVAYNPNALGQARQAGTYATGITYHPSGAIKGFTYGNGIVHSMSQNLRGLPEWSIDNGILNDHYTYDQNANVLSIVDGQEGVSTRSMEYDGIDRLKHVAAPSVWGDAWYGYDALDNLVSTQLTAGGTARTTTHTFDPATNRLTTVSNSAGSAYNYGYQYDVQGNIVQRGSQGYTFDMANRMTSATGKGTYAYDGLGRRVSVVGTDGVNRIQVYSQEGQLLFATASGAPLAAGIKYVYLDRHVIAEVGGGVQYDHTDGLGSPVALTDAARGVISRTRYEPYGVTAAGPTPALGFGGHVSAADLGLVYMQQRYYDPVAGRFLSIDPVMTDANSGGSFNRYAYVSNNPYKHIDPDGRNEEMAYGAGVAFAGLTPAQQATWASGERAATTQGLGSLQGFALGSAAKQFISAPTITASRVASIVASALVAKISHGKSQAGPKPGTLPDKVFSSKASNQVTPGTTILQGQHINDKGRVEPWTAHYDEHGRQVGRTDYNAGNKAQGIPDTHHHTYEYGPGKNGMETGSHLPGEYQK